MRTEPSSSSSKSFRLCPMLPRRAELCILKSNTVRRIIYMFNNCFFASRKVKLTAVICLAFVLVVLYSSSQNNYTMEDIWDTVFSLPVIIVISVVVAAIVLVCVVCCCIKCGCCGCKKKSNTEAKPEEEEQRQDFLSNSSSDDPEDQHGPGQGPSSPGGQRDTAIALDDTQKLSDSFFVEDETSQYDHNTSQMGTDAKKAQPMKQPSGDHNGQYNLDARSKEPSQPHSSSGHNDQYNYDERRAQPPQQSSGSYHQPPQQSSKSYHQPPQQSSGSYHQPPQQSSGSYHQPPQQSSGSYHQPPQQSSGSYHQPPQQSSGSYHQPSQPPSGSNHQPSQDNDQYNYGARNNERSTPLSVSYNDQSNYDERMAQPPQQPYEVHPPATVIPIENDLPHVDAVDGRSFCEEVIIQDERGISESYNNVAERVQRDIYHNTTQEDCGKEIWKDQQEESNKDTTDISNQGERIGKYQQIEGSGATNDHDLEYDNQHVGNNKDPPKQFYQEEENMICDQQEQNTAETIEHDLNNDDIYLSRKDPKNKELSNEGMEEDSEMLNEISEDTTDQPGDVDGKHNVGHFMNVDGQLDSPEKENTQQRSRAPDKALGDNDTEKRQRMAEEDAASDKEQSRLKTTKETEWKTRKEKVPEDSAGDDNRSQIKDSREARQSRKMNRDRYDDKDEQFNKQREDQNRKDIGKNRNNDRDGCNYQEPEDKDRKDVSQTRYHVRDGPHSLEENQLETENKLPDDKDKQLGDKVKQPDHLDMQPEEEKPLDYKNKPLDEDKQPGYKDKQPNDKDKQLGDKVKQPDHLDMQPENKVKQPEDEKPLDDKNKPLDEDKQPDDKDKQPNDKDKQLGDKVKQPDHLDIQPENMVKQPEDEKPLDDKNKPLDGDKQPDDKDKQPNDKDKQLGDKVKQPDHLDMQPENKVKQPEDKKPLDDKNKPLDEDKQPGYKVKQPEDDMDINEEKSLPCQEEKTIHFVVPKEIYADARVSAVLKLLELKFQWQFHVVAGDACGKQQQGTLILPVIAASRVGSDVEAAVNGSKVPGDTRMLLVLFHHKASHNSRIFPTRDKSFSNKDLQSRFTDIIDFVYWNGDMYDCQTNRTAFKELTDASEKADMYVRLTRSQPAQPVQSKEKQEKKRRSQSYDVKYRHRSPKRSKQEHDDRGTREKTVLVIPEESFDDDRVRNVLDLLKPQLRKQLPGVVFDVVPGGECGKQQQGTLILPVIAASRVGSDVEAAVNGSNVPGHTRMLLLLFHHKAAHNSKIFPTRDKSFSNKDLESRFTDIIDFVYWMRDMYDCQTNRTAFQELTAIINPRDATPVSY